MLAAVGVGPIGPFEALLFFGAIVWVVPLWVICDKIGWHPALSLIAFIPLVGAIFGLLTVWEALGKAQHSRWLVLILLIPLVNLIFIYWLAFSTWPSQTTRAAPMTY